ncbi:hypothetical protein DIZ81_03235 [Legionella taurinensis]|uniref:Uncharacterized protein n=1 Tax=Legionella taurinensis TaxID=70611 RepID=A0A3A5LFD1_9GAMM|nr:hypothetical protein [Legionella taurinensis]MDX1836112.1 hypothetical protein [Legionella taurinensis]PUT42114.1 hypothetical protein DB744_03235 [Legionella taurinensis]PUT44901.1 hypothetical protein DB746_03235 [Legionella taurinensis]PUT48223.1 hypothetical protein DB743_01400 [Legionella taurinensis]PUT49036.1 hypothetical protein DB745_03235 [Legionella taurinensis]
MEWFYKLLYSLVDHYVSEKEREAAKFYVDIILEHSLEICASNTPVEIRGVSALHGVDLGVIDYQGNKERLWRMKVELSDLAYDYFLTQRNPQNTTPLSDLLTEAEECIRATMSSLKWPNKKHLQAQGTPDLKKKEAEASFSEDIFVYEGTPLNEETAVQDESVTEEEQSVSSDSSASDSSAEEQPLGPKTPTEDTLRREVILMFNQVVQHIDEGKGLLSLETCFGVLSKLLDILHGIYTLPNDDHAFILQAIVHMSGIPNETARVLYQKIGGVNSWWTTDACQTFALHVEKELYHLLVSGQENNAREIVAAADRLYLILWELAGIQLTQTAIRNLILSTGNALKKHLNEKVPPLLDLNDFKQFPNGFFKTSSGQEFYVHLHKEVYDLSLNQKTEEDLIAASERLYLFLWEINSPLTPANVTAIVRASLKKQLDDPSLSLFSAVNSAPFPPHFFKSATGYLFLDHLQNAILRLPLNKNLNEETVLAVTEHFYLSLPAVLLGVMPDSIIDLLKVKMNQLTLKLVIDKDAPLYTFDLLKYVARANRILGGALKDAVLNHQFITQFKSDRNYHKRKWDADAFAELLLGLMILYIKQDESYFVLSTADFYKKEFVFLKNPGQKAAAVKEILTIEKEVFALIDHNAMIDHERLQQFVNEESAEIADILLEDCRKQSSEFHKEMSAYYQPPKTPCTHSGYSCLFFPSFKANDSGDSNPSSTMETEDSEEAGCWLQ